MATEAILTPGIDVFNIRDLARKAATYKGLKLWESASEVCSEPIGEYDLDNGLLAVLAERGIVRRGREDPVNKILTLVDENPQVEVPGAAPGNYWNFKLFTDDKHKGQRKFDLRVSLIVDFRIDVERNGFVLQA